MVTVKNYSGNSFTLSAPFLHDCQSKASIVIRTPNGWDLHLLIKQRESPSICTVVNEMLSSPEQVIATIKQRLQEHGEPSEINHRELMQYMRLCEEPQTAMSKGMKVGENP